MCLPTCNCSGWNFQLQGFGLGCSLCIWIYIYVWESMSKLLFNQIQEWYREKAFFCRYLRGKKPWHTHCWQSLSLSWVISVFTGTCNWAFWMIWGFFYPSNSPSWFWSTWMALQICHQHEKKKRFALKFIWSLCSLELQEGSKVSFFPVQVSSLLCGLALQ